MIETQVTQNIITDIGSKQHLIVHCKPICDYYHDYSKYQTALGEVLLSYSKTILFLTLDKCFLNLTNAGYTLDAAL